LTSSSAPMSSNLTPISLGGTTAEMKLRSYSSFAKICSKASFKVGRNTVEESPG
jgi:hypothetical protein